MELLGYYIDMNLLLICLGIFFGIIFLFTLSALIISIKANRKMRKFIRENKKLNIVNAIEEYYDKCQEIRDSFNETQERVRILETENKACIKKVGSLRYDAFGENNTNLSFVAALLDESDSGFVINGVYTRENTITYLKTLREGKSIFALSDEEMQAISLAKENYEKKTNKSLR